MDRHGRRRARLVLNPHANLGNPLLPGNKNLMVHSPAEAWPWQGMALAVHLLRFYSMLLGLGTVYFTYRLAQLLFPQNAGLVIAVAAFVAFNPQFIFILSAISNDNLIIFLSTVTLWLLAGLLTTPASDISRSLPWRPLALPVSLAWPPLPTQRPQPPGADVVRLCPARSLAATLALRPDLGRWWWWSRLSSSAAGGMRGTGNCTAMPPDSIASLRSWGHGPLRLPGATFSASSRACASATWRLFGWFNIVLPCWVYVRWDLFLT